MDVALVWDAAELIISTRGNDNSNHTIVIAGGDKDFLRVHAEGIKAGYNVEFYCWEQSTCKEILKLPGFLDSSP